MLEEKVIVDLGSLDSNCPLCEILSKIVGSHVYVHHKFGYGMPGSATSPLCYFSEPLQDFKKGSSRGLGPYGGSDLLLRLWRRVRTSNSFSTSDIGSHVWIKPFPISAEALPPDSALIKYGRYQDLIQDCNTGHSVCNEHQSTSDASVVRVIDCRNGELVSPGDQAYLTLSYVWGDPSALETDGIEQTAFPPTIKDAMQVTLALGYHYLWVDRYCINQNDKTEVLQQMSIMDIIYQKSALTIIAACGGNPYYGLPGVSNRSRRSYHQSQGSSLYMREILSQEGFIRNSYWNKRGWTYQEALFARRRLVFTDYEVYYECSQLGLWESCPVCFQPFGNT